MMLSRCVIDYAEFVLIKPDNFSVRQIADCTSVCSFKFTGSMMFLSRCSLTTSSYCLRTSS